MIHDTNLQAGVERMWQKEYDDRFGEETVSDCCEAPFTIERDPQGGGGCICDKCGECCNVIEV